MFRRFILNSHLYIGLILTVTTIMLAVTGFYLNHQHDWFHQQNIHYINPKYEAMVDEALHLKQSNKNKVPEAVQKAADDGLFKINHIKSVNYASHGLGYFYYVHLKDLIVVVTENGEIAKSYSDPLIKNWMRNLHVGMSDSINFVFINDVTTIGIIILTVTGWVLAIRILMARSRQKKHRIK